MDQHEPEGYEGYNSDDDYDFDSHMGEPDDSHVVIHPGMDTDAESGENSYDGDEEEEDHELCVSPDDEFIHDNEVEEPEEDPEQGQEPGEDFSSLSRQQRIRLLKKQEEKVEQLVQKIIELRRTKMLGKDGYIRQRIVGRPTGQCGRSVLTVTDIPLDHIAIPMRFAKSLRKSIVVDEDNISDLQALVDNYPKYPCVHAIHCSSGKTIFNKKGMSVKLRKGDKVLRSVIDGDYVFANRQPTLCRSSIMIHKVIVKYESNNRTISINPLMLGLYSGDCDGDEINIYVPITNDIGEGGHVKDSVTSEKSGKAAIIFTNDTSRAGFTLTYDCYFTLEEMQFLTEHLHVKQPPIPCIVKPKALYSGKQIFSLALPKCLCIEEEHLVIERGQLLKGAVDKQSMNLIFNLATSFLGPEKYLSFVRKLQVLLHKYIERFGTSGHTISLEDYQIRPDQKEKMLSVRKQKFQEKKRRKMVTELHRYLTEGVANFPKALREQFKRTLEKGEADVFGAILSTAVQCNEQCGSHFCQQTLIEIQQDYAASDDRKAFVEQEMLEPVEKSYDFYADEVKAFKGTLRRSNNLWAIDTSGSKNETEKVMMSMVWLGYKYISNFDLEKALKEGSDDMWRCYSYGVSDRLYCEKLSQESWQAVYNRHCATAQTGYLYRRLSRVLEDVCVHADGSVRLGDNRLLQPTYGNDGFSTNQTQMTKMVVGDFDEVETRQINDFVKTLSDSDMPYWKQELAEIQELRQSEDPCSIGESTVSVRIPFKTKDLLLVYRNKVNDRTPLSVKTKNEMLKQLLVDVHKLGTPKNNMSDNNPMFRSELKRYIQLELFSPVVMGKYNLCLEEFDLVLKHIQFRCTTAAVAIGRRVGLIAAQSLIQPLTQIMLDSVHTPDKNKREAFGRIEALLQNKNETIIDTFRNEGIEAARKVFKESLSNVYKHAGDDVDEKHTNIIVDVLTIDGELNPLSRFSLWKTSLHYMKSTFFEQPLVPLALQAFNHTNDPLHGITENLVFNKPCGPLMEEPSKSHKRPHDTKDKRAAKKAKGNHKRKTN
ncbi:DNA-directed RNA polymerase II subunit RPB1-like [Penaeus japonicus]|uniref:DNA-directed RNA polymerase II subunit RPB1-like n=1 Tax=Penaeus japonicus TaxID=27405 RepID=UPI001C70F20B|nr:DNA-directed RNA polymerase II subunit RPB1-like [Penaeus japonicus]